MGTPKSLEVRKIVLDSHLNGNSTKKILEIKGGSVAKRTVNKWIQTWVLWCRKLPICPNHWPTM